MVREVLPETAGLPYRPKHLAVLAASRSDACRAEVGE